MSTRVRVWRMDRKTGILLVTLLLSILVFTWPQKRVGSSSDDFELTVLHTNDTHGHLDSFPCLDQRKQYMSWGGVARRITAITEIRKIKQNLLLLDAGDVYEGSVYSEAYHGLADLWFMNEMKYDAMCLGNHEFDMGEEYLFLFLSNCRFPVLCANLEFKNLTLAKLVRPYTVIELGSERIGIFGLTIENNTSVMKLARGRDLVNTAAWCVRELRSLGINKIVALTHIDLSNDVILARSVPGIDIIVGGHGHYVLGPFPFGGIGGSAPYPVLEFTPPSEDPVLIVTAGYFGKYLGRLDVKFDREGRLVSNSWKKGASGLIWLDDTTLEDDHALRELRTFSPGADKLLSDPILRSTIDLEGRPEETGREETNLGDLVADAVLFFARARSENATLALVNSGSINASIFAGRVNRNAVRKALPYEDSIVVFSVSGDTLLDALENSISQLELPSSRFLQLSGVRIKIDPTRPVGHRVLEAEVSILTKWVPLEKAATYRIASTSFLLEGGDGYTCLLRNAKMVRNLSDPPSLAVYFFTNRFNVRSLNVSMNRIIRVESAHYQLLLSISLQLIFLSICVAFSFLWLNRIRRARMENLSER